MKYKLKDLAVIKRGASPRPINEYVSEKGYPWLKISDFSLNDKFVYKTKEFIIEAGLKKTRYVKSGTLIVTNSATPGIPIFLMKDMCLHDGFLYFESISPKIDKEYLYYFILNNRSKLIKLGNGSVFVNLKKEILENYEIELPSIDVQHKIARYLSAIDEKIKLNNEINDNLMQQLNSVYHSIFDSTIFEKKVPLGDYFDVSIGKTPPRKEQWWFSTNTSDVKWVSISDMGSCGTFISSTSEYLTNEAITKFNVVLVPDNTVILSFKLTVGRLAITDGEMATNEAIAHFKTNNKTINPYLYMFLKNYKYGNLGSTSSIATAVNSKIIKSIQFLVPGEKDIAKFNEVAIPMLSQIKEIQHEVRALSELRDSLLPKLMSGEIDVDSIEL